MQCDLYRGHSLCGRRPAEREIRGFGLRVDTAVSMLQYVRLSGPGCRGCCDFHMFCEEIVQGRLGPNYVSKPRAMAGLRGFIYCDHPSEAVEYTAMRVTVRLIERLRQHSIGAESVGHPRCLNE